jgi:eukaryotic-like serine/threonine-protein kinase
LEVLDQAGDRAGALQKYESFASWLHSEYGAEPPPETVQLIERIRSRSEPAASVPAQAAAIPQAPPPTAATREDSPSARPIMAAARRGTRWRRTGILAGFLVASALIPAILALKKDSRPALDPNLLAVAPFRVFEGEQQIWGEGIVDYLSRSLDGAGALRTLSPTASVRAWPGRLDVESAADAGIRTGAGIVLFGSLMGIGGDSVRVNATLVDAVGASVLGDLEIRGAPARMDQLVDSLTVEILRTLSDTRQIGAMRRTSIGSRSMPALRAFLAGEQAFRRTDWEGARDDYQRAVELDSAFAMAHLRLGSTLQYLNVGGSDEGWEQIILAGKLNRNLSLHDSLMVSVGSDLAHHRIGREPEGGFLGLGERAYSNALQATRLYPDDAEAWNMVGIVRDWFYDELPSVTVAQVADAFDRAIALDSAFAPAYRPAFRYAMDEGRVETARAYARTYLSLNPPEASSGIPLLMDRILDPASSEAELDSLMNGMHPEALFQAWISLWLLTDSTELAIRVARKSADRGHDPRYWTTAPMVADRNLAASLAYRGHVRESAEVASLDYATWFQALLPEAAMMGVVPAEIADSAFADWLERDEFDPDVLAHELWWWASRADTSAILRYVERGGDEPIGTAALALARSDTAEALLRLERVKTSWIHTNLTVLVRARLLESQGRDAEALEVLQQRFLNDWPLASRVLWVLERARLEEKLGQPEPALRDYRFVTHVWAHADPELQPVVREADEAVVRLAGRGAESRAD